MIDNVRLPTTVEAGAVGGPRFKTVVQASLSGKEQRIAEWDESRGEWDIGYGIRSVEDLAIVLALFRARGGRLHPFRFKDWSDYIATDVLIGVGDGSTTSFQLIKTYDDGVLEHERTILLPIVGTVVIKVNGIEQVEGSIAEPEDYNVVYESDPQGTITFESGSIPANGHEITASFEFDVPVRFDDDVIRIRMREGHLGEAPSINIVEVVGE